MTYHLDWAADSLEVLVDARMSPVVHTRVSGVSFAACEKMLWEKKVRRSQ